jgi:hypothetical protein
MKLLSFEGQLSSQSRLFREVFLLGAHRQWTVLVKTPEVFDSVALRAKTLESKPFLGLPSTWLGRVESTQTNEAWGVI